MGAKELENVPDTSEVRFTLEWYREFLHELESLGYEYRRFSEKTRPGDLLLRHDVDWSPERARRMAKLEAELGVTATYFFLLTSPMYNALHDRNRENIRAIASLGHDVGVHFSTHQYWNEPQDAETVQRSVQAERDIFRSAITEPTEAVSFHIPPEWIFNQSFEEFLSTYEERFFTEFDYRADSNQRWRTEHPLADGAPEKLQVLVHPGLWDSHDASFAQRLSEVRTETFGEVDSVLVDQFIDQNVNT